MQHDLQSQTLQQMAIFGGVSDEALQFLLDGAGLVQAQEGGYFMREGDAATGLFVLMDGRVAVQRLWDDRQVLLRELGPGDCFGEMALLDLGRRSASVRALEPCRALDLGTGLLHSFFEHDPRQFALIQMNIARELSRRLRTTFNLLFAASSPGERELVEKILQRV